MDAFEWIGLTNGEAIVVHREHSHVYRFSPCPQAGWARITLSRQERGSPLSEHPSVYAGAARDFARAQIGPLLGSVLPW